MESMASWDCQLPHLVIDRAYLTSLTLNLAELPGIVVHQNSPLCTLYENEVINDGWGHAYGADTPPHSQAPLPHWPSPTKTLVRII